MSYKLIVGIIIGFLLATGISYAYRIQKPQRITDFDQNNLVTLNDTLEALWDITNGRYSPTSGATASTGTGTIKMGNASNANSAGFVKFIKTDGTTIFIPYFTDDTP